MQFEKKNPLIFNFRNVEKMFNCEHNVKFLAVLMPFYDFLDFFGNIQLEPISELKSFRHLPALYYRRRQLPSLMVW